MGRFINSNQYIDVVECLEEDNKQIIWKFERHQNEIKHGARLIVRPGQVAVFIHRGQLADVFSPGHYSLKTRNLPILSTILAAPFGFNSPIKSDVYFINTTQFFGMKWETASPILRRDSEMGMVRISASGNFAFQITNPHTFLETVYGAHKKDTTEEIAAYLSSFVGEAVAQCIGEMDVSVLDLAMTFRRLSAEISQYANDKAFNLGITIPEAVIEHISLPREVEKLIDEQSGIGLASRNMDNFMQYQTARAMRDAARQDGGLAGLGASFALGNQMGQAVTNVASHTSGPHNALADKLRELKRLMNEGLITQSEFEQMKQRILGEMTGNRETTSRPAPDQQLSQNDMPPVSSPAPQKVTSASTQTTHPMIATPAPKKTVNPAATPSSAQLSYPGIRRRSNGAPNTPPEAYAEGREVCFGGLKWTVLQQTSPSHALLICNETIADAPFNESATAVSWENSTLRRWLNEEFLNNQFTASEIKAIMKNFLRPEKSNFSSIDPGRPTQDAIFCIGAREYTKRLPKDIGKYYWLRSPGKTATEFSAVTPQGRITSMPVDRTDISVRPALWIDLTSRSF